MNHLLKYKHIYLTYWCFVLVNNAFLRLANFYTSGILEYTQTQFFSALLLTTIEFLAVHLNYFIYKTYWKSNRKLVFIVCSLLIIGDAFFRAFILELIFYWTSFVYSRIPVIVFENLIFFGIYSILRSREIQEQNDSLTQHNLINQQNILRAQIQPHFIMNTLNNIYARLQLNKREVDTMILKLSQLFRYSYTHLDKAFVSLDTDLEYLTNYIDLESERLSNATIDVAISVPKNDFTIAPFILITFVENAFKHGLSESVENVFLNLDISLQGNDLFFSCVNGYSTLNNTDLNNTGQGLKNVTTRLDLIYTNKYELTLHDDKDTYEVFLKLNLDRNVI